MRWAWAKILTLIGAAIATLGAASAAQGPAFVQVYLQRLGGHIDEARRTLGELSDGDAARIVGDGPSHDRLVGAFAERLGDLEASRSLIESASPLWRPVALALHGDRDIASAAAESFTPALPLDVTSLLYAVAGLVVGLLVWEICQWPVKAKLRRRKARQQRLENSRGS
ncbi:MAG: DUF2937 family protein [Alphaproteobacteria bacterium]